MLNDMLQLYIKAKESNNTKELSKIEKQLNRLGMDNYTIRVLVKELEEENEQ